MEFIEIFEMKMPVIGLGTWNLRGKECFEATISALEIGYRHIDTAEMYENESEIGEAIAQSLVPRNEIFLTTKVWSTHLQYQDVILSLENSLKKLKTDYVDLLLIHWPNPNISLSETFKAMNYLKNKEMLRFIGLSNFSKDLLMKAQKISFLPIMNVQVEYHPFLDQNSILSYCQKNNISLTAYCPIARGRDLNNPTLEKIASKYEKTVPQIMLRWLIQQKKVVAIPKAKSAEHQKLNFDIFDFQLSSDDMYTIFQLNRGQRLVKG
ncbi:MAG TPA: aldo/keto reductase [Candidatus Atribacteria bacterium]|nr:aldo/keto reductase [Candidatus Atribacteria bacterium]